MAIARVKAVLNVQTYNLTYDAASGTYKATVTAPGSTSYNQAGGYYNVSTGNIINFTYTGVRVRRTNKWQTSTEPERRYPIFC